MQTIGKGCLMTARGFGWALTISKYVIDVVKVMRKVRCQTLGCHKQIISRYSPMYISEPVCIWKYIFVWNEDGPSLITIPIRIIFLEIELLCKKIESFGGAYFVGWIGPDKYFKHHTKINLD